MQKWYKSKGRLGASGYDGPVDDLLADMESEGVHPDDFLSLEAMLGYLRACNACPQAIDAARRLFDDEGDDQADDDIVKKEEVASTNIEILDEDWRFILRRCRAKSLTFTLTDGVRVGKRSEVIWKIGRTLRERGATPSEVATVLWASRCFRAKHRNSRSALRGEVQRIFNKPL